jgi:hypothetical protein
MTIDEMKAEAEKAKKLSEDHWRLHLQWLGVAQYLAGRIADAEAVAQKSPAG